MLTSFCESGLQAYRFRQESRMRLGKVAAANAETLPARQ
jgi:hypothetical protein